ncbi:hypothetical protein [Saccharothrix sp. HUAS TT1]|uniref:hypothetical protein n=1 Tax=unclassified Saccharothrix TaxID=2593673 RepID=UPI00345C60EC
MPGITDVPLVREILGGDLFKAMGTAFDRIEWAEDEIQRAMRRNPAEADLLYHSFELLKATHDRMDSERVFRAHCRELLQRVVNREDTRPGTAAEVCCIASDASKVTPLNTSAAGLYFRMWQKAFPDLVPAIESDLPHYEALKGSQIDDLEAESRRKLAVAERVLGEIECGGWHNGDRVQCKYVGDTD